MRLSVRLAARRPAAAFPRPSSWRTLAFVARTSPARTLDEPALLERMQLVAQAFRPAAPVDRRSLFSGRTDEIAELFAVVAQPGQHAVVYGERGVGKTSLTKVVAELLASSGVLIARATCDSGDDFSSVWRKALGEIALHTERRGIGFSAAPTDVMTSATVALGDGSVTPHAVSRALEALGHPRPLAVFLDEFDRLSSPACRALFTDTIKLLSDRAVPATLVLIGVADTVHELIREHRSVERALVQVRMPRMARDELAEIARLGIGSAQMTIQKPAVDRVTAISQGLPHFTHLLTQLAAQAALSERHADVGGPEVDFAVERAIQRAQQSVTEAYLRAETVGAPLLAAALAEDDEFGFFGTSDAAVHLERVGDTANRDELPAVLDRLANDLGILQTREAADGRRYRFANPLLPPYVVMRGLADGLVTTSDLR
jgi:energy-coupling factor transporter ATP-binding protein EcfA2